MVEIEITKMSSKGQIVIPSKMRKDFKVGEKFIIIKDKNRLILRRASDLDRNFLEDLEFARRTEEAFKRYKEGKFKEVSGDKFIDMLETW
ncbi:MAG: AbrB/MazE/SpoVT family DNA-binding domain-containing protein [Thermoplasmata archaeon]|nr:MAG: AbrB/MazE/SpoVT family DNA-binding domain-containing protein [Thermoplasmata archaeon]